MAENEAWQVADQAAVIYEQKMVPALCAGWAPQVADAAGIVPGNRVLDVACGTGVLAREARKRVGSGSVTGIDLNEGMLAVAKQLQPDVEWHLGDAESLPFEDESFDVVVCQFGLMFFADRAAALREMWRVLMPGGRMAVASWASFERAEGYRVLAEIAERRTTAEAAAILRAPFEIGDADTLLAFYRSADIDNVTLDTRDDFARFPSVEELVAAEVKGSPIGERLSEVEYQALLDEAKDLLATYCNGDGSLAAPIAAHIVSARKV